MKRLFAAAAIVTLTIVGADAARLMSEQEARARAIAILKGEPYGKTAAQVARLIKQARLAQNGSTKACGARQLPAAWEFHVVVVTAQKELYNKGVIDGYLAIDARTGKLLCANLPLLD
jgi:hypothetical protein